MKLFKFKTPEDDLEFFFNLEMIQAIEPNSTDSVNLSTVTIAGECVIVIGNCQDLVNEMKEACK